MILILLLLLMMIWLAISLWTSPVMRLVPWVEKRRLLRVERFERAERAEREMWLVTRQRL